MSQSLPFKIPHRPVLFCVCLLAGSAVNAQHAGHGQREDTTGIAALTETLPVDDAVLSQAPRHLQLQFPGAVRLVKLTLRNAHRDWVDISFRYDPLPDSQFVWQLPPLQSARYYIADWAILAADDQLVRGSFSFAFGPDALRPSQVMAEEALHLLAPGEEAGTRYVAPPPTQIIIDREPREFDPPFTIDLKEDDR